MLKIARAPESVKDISPLSWGGGGGQNRIDPNNLNLIAKSLKA